MLSIGDPAPAFTLPDINGDPVDLTASKGRKRLVVFIPFPFTGNCDAEACALRDNLAQLKDLDAEVLVITCHAKPVNKKWAEENGFEFPVLSDFWPHGNVARAYGAFNEDVGAANRFSFAIDGDGVVRAIVSTETLGVAREYSAQVGALQQI
jgi:peroxiredoxin